MVRLRLAGLILATGDSGGPEISISWGRREEVPHGRFGSTFPLGNWVVFCVLLQLE